MLFTELLQLIKNGELITIVSQNMNTNSQVAILYFYLVKYLNNLEEYVSITKSIIINHKLRISVRGHAKTKENMKQIHFVNINNIQKWMLESNERIEPLFKTNETLKKYKIHSKVMYKQRNVILLDNVVIPDKFNPFKVIVGNVVDSLEHHEWKLHLAVLIKKFNELKSKYYLSYNELKCLNNNSKSLQNKTFENFVTLTEQQINIIRKTDATKMTKHKFGDDDLLISTEIMNKKSDLEILQEQILIVQNSEPKIIKYTLTTNIISDLPIKYPKLLDMMISINETKLLFNSVIKNTLYDYLKTLNNNSNMCIFHIAVNNLPKLINYVAPNYLNKMAWNNINILRLDYYIIDSKLKILKKQSFLIANEKIHNTIGFEANNNINDNYRNSHGISFQNIVAHFNEDLVKYDVKYLISHGTDVNYNLLLIEYQRYLQKLDIFNNLIIINTKQYLWKKDIKEKLDTMECCAGCKTKIDMIYALLKVRLNIK